MKCLLNILRDNRGVSAIEYAIIASLISVAAMAGYTNLGGKVESNFNNVDQALDGTL
jgi:pilus assembly protein Flp/PilA